MWPHFVDTEIQAAARRSSEKNLLRRFLLLAFKGLPSLRIVTMQPVQILLLGLASLFFFLINTFNGNFGFCWCGSRRDHGFVNAVCFPIYPPGFCCINAARVARCEGRRLLPG